jgi:hypothetical protein
VHVQADPVFADLDICACVTQFRQHRIQGIWLRVAAGSVLRKRY